jgi:hypothetical protein
MTSFDAMNLLAEQLKRNVANGKNYKTKVVVTPSSISEKGVILKVSLLKTTPDKTFQAKSKQRTVRLRVQVAGRAESQTGLQQAVELIENLDKYLESENLRLEEPIEAANGMQSFVKIPNTRIIQTLSPDDSFIDSPDSTSVQDVEDNRIIDITIPMEE